MNRYILVLGATLTLAGCASFDSAMQETENELKKPLVPGTTQPTREETLQTTASTLNPWAGLVVGLGLYSLHEYNSFRRNKKTLNAISNSKGE